MNPLEEILRKIINSQTVFKSAKLVNNTLIVVLNDGQILSKKGATQEDYNAIINAKSTIGIKEVVNVNNEESNHYEAETTLITASGMKKTIKSRIVKIK
jgi:predicted house-cleaning noncanonical NTP pyrophosphatase (MazG superfamily)